MNKTILILFIIISATKLQAQNGVAINTSGASPDASAVLDVSATTQGVLIPRVNIADLSTATPVTSPVTSLLVYNTNSTTGPGFFFWDGTAWASFSAEKLNDLGDAKTTASDQSLFLGSLAGNAATGANNVGVGYNALNTLNSGTGNTAIGAGAGSSVTGSDNILIGKSVLPAANGNSNELNIGDLIYGAKVYNATGNIGIGNGNNAPDASALLDMSSTTMGLLIPQMTQTQRDAISTPATGLMIYQTDGTAGFYYYDGSVWTSATGAKAINDLTDGKTFAEDVFLGVGAGSAATSAQANTGVGKNALSNTTGFSNTALGWNAGGQLENGNSNILIGEDAQASTATSSNELNIGDLIYGTNVSNATGSVGIGNGNNAPDASAVLDIQSTTNGILIPRMDQAQRDAISSPATSLMVYQTDNTPGFYYYNGSSWVSTFGAQAINDLSDATYSSTTNTLGLGPSASSSGTFEVAVGEGALQNSSGTNNTAVGYQAGNAVTSGINNVYLGLWAGKVATSGDANVGVGKEALVTLTTGSDNIRIGFGSGNVTTGSNNIIIGNSTTTVPTNTADGQINIGNTIHGTGAYTSTAKIGIGDGNSAPTSTLDVSGSVSKSIVVKTASYTATDQDYTIIFNTSSTVTLNLPTASTCSGRVYVIKTLFVTGSATVTIDPDGSESIFYHSSAATIDIGDVGSERHSVTIQSDGTRWYVISDIVFP